MRTIASLMLASAVLAGGCAPRLVGAHAVQPSQPGDTQDVWIWLQTNNPDVDGVYRCYDNGMQPICKRARLQIK